jgi:DNA-binding MarR family transcriptional regulator
VTGSPPPRQPPVDSRESNHSRSAPDAPRPAGAHDVTPAREPTQDRTAVAISSASIDRVIHERLRLAIVGALAVNASLSFTELKHLLGMTDGNLSVHARKLEDAGYIVCTRGMDGRVPRTEYRLTPAGRAALTQYLNRMEALIRAMRGT